MAKKTEEKILDELIKLNATLNKFIKDWHFRRGFKA